MKVKSKRNVVGFASLLVLILLIGITSIIVIHKKNEANKWVNHTYEIIGNIEELNFKLNGAESAARAFMISANNKHYNDYKAYVEATHQEVQEIEALIKDNKVQNEKLNVLVSLIKERFEDLNKKINHRQHKGFDSVLIKTTTIGSALMLKVQSVSSEMKREEETLLIKRSEKAEDINLIAQYIIILGTLISIITVLLLILNIRKLFNKQRLIELDLIKTNQSLEKFNKEEQQRNWILTGTTQLNSALHQQQNVEQTCTEALKQICNYGPFELGAFYLLNHETDLELVSSYGFNPTKKVFQLNEGFLGQAAAEKKDILLDELPSSYFKVQSSFIEGLPKWVYFLCLHLDGKALGVLEIAGVREIKSQQLSFLKYLKTDLTLTLQAAIEKRTAEKLNFELKKQSVQLQKQQEELKAINEELMLNTDALLQSEEELKMQSKELQSMNTVLEEKAQQLNDNIRELNNSKIKLEQASKYKSEFLANMSHELRTPLNSILVLAKLLQENKTENLTAKQLEYASVILKAGSDLLTLINDVLDLSKIESGKVEVQNEPFIIDEFITNQKGLFSVIADERNIRFEIQKASSIPSKIYTDGLKLEQIIRNLLSNAFKFTPQGGYVKLLIDSDFDFDKREMIVFHVEDNGIGIAKEKQQVIFEAFKQADGSVNRKFGGTGLGLSISLHLVKLLGGWLSLKSEENKGSTFSVHIPLVQQVPENNSLLSEAKTESKNILIIEDDNIQAYQLQKKILKHFENIHCDHANTTKQALELLSVKQYHCLIIDLHMPEKLNVDLIREMKRKSAPNVFVIINSGLDFSLPEEKEFRQLSKAIVIKGPQANERIIKVIETNIFNTGPFTEPEWTDDINQPDPAGKNFLKDKSIFLIDDDMRNVFTLTALFQENNMKVISASDGLQAIEKLKNETQVDIILTDIMMPGMDGYETIKAIRQLENYKHVPIIALTAKSMKDDRKKCIESGASDYIVKPVENKQLLQLVKMHIYNNKMNRYNNE